MKPYEEIDFPNGFLRWIREDGMYVCSLTEEQMAKIKALHEAPRTWVGLTDEERRGLREWQKIQEELGPVWAPMMLYLYEALEAKFKEKNT